MADDKKPDVGELQTSIENFLGCSPELDRVVFPNGLQLGDQPDFLDDILIDCPDGFEDVPEFLAKPDWRARAIKERSGFPAGYTYFSQLVGHDIGNSVSLASVPYSFSGTEVEALAAGRDPTRYNLIENALTLETIYGQGPTIATHIYDPATFKFDIRPDDKISRQFSLRFDEIRAIHDNRNRDTVMLHRLAASMMKFHNKIVEEIEPNDLKLRSARRSRKLRVYAQARAHVIDVWHALIREDLMPTMLIDHGANLGCIEDKDQLSDTTLLHGVFRVFHALPLEEYLFDDQSFLLKEVLASNILASEEETNGWEIDWRNFFDTAKDGNKTGFSASITEMLSRGMLNLPKLDALTVMKTSPLRLKDPRTSVFIQILPEEFRENVSPDRLAQDFKDAYEIDVSAKTLGCGALHVALMVEAHLHGPGGRLGPLGSLLLASALETRMQAVHKTDAPIEVALSTPKTMLELLETVNT